MPAEDDGDEQPALATLTGDELVQREAALRAALVAKVAAGPSSSTASASAASAPAAAAVAAVAARSRWEEDEEDAPATVQPVPAEPARRRAAAEDEAATPGDRVPGTPDSVATPTPTPTPAPGGRGAMPVLAGCRSVDHYEKLNKIDEGAYGVVYRARDKATGDIVALKRLKIEKEREGFPITSLREINTLLLAKHRHIVNVREIVVGDSIDQIFIVMDFVEHDLKYLMETMSAPFRPSEVKTIIQQLLQAVGHLHDNWIIHRDLKTSNMLFTNRGELKLGDFGLARLFGDPMGKMTPLVVTLWYRAPELLLGALTYTTAIDMWAVGCIFAELIQKRPLFPGSGELDQLQKIFALLGKPTSEIWPDFDKLPHSRKLTFQPQPYNFLSQHFTSDSVTKDLVTPNTIDLLGRMLAYDPARRIAADQALRHPYFSERPLPKDPSMFPTWPSRAELRTKKARVHDSPSAPNKPAATDDDEEEYIREARDRYGVFAPTAPEFRLSFGPM